jgi:HPr kinase/phosphorylase
VSAAPQPASPGVHATALIYGESGLLIRGPSGAGKSSLALALLIRARDCGLFAALVGDDRVYLAPMAGRLIARGAEVGSGQIERRMSGLVGVAHEPAAVIRLVVDLSPRAEPWPRMPLTEDETAEFDGIALPRLALDAKQGPYDHAIAAHERLTALAADKSGGMTNFP